ncbi:MAG: transposase [Magnetococcales bacterium]|nr:transposase [Magnetococcales bacterium]
MSDEITLLTFDKAFCRGLKYHPGFPNRFGSVEDARNFCRFFFAWYNTEHRHSGIVMLTPESVHYGTAEQILEKRREVLDAAAQKHPNRFKGRQPDPGRLPEKVWINPPKPTLMDAVVVNGEKQDMASSDGRPTMPKKTQPEVDQGTGDLR